MALKKKVGKKKTSKKAPRKVVAKKKVAKKKIITKKRISKFAATRRTKKSYGKPTGFEGFRSEMRNRPELIEKVHKVGAVFLVKALGFSLPDAEELYKEAKKLHNERLRKKTQREKYEKRKAVILRGSSQKGPRHKYDDTAHPFLTKSGNISKTKLAKHWSDGYKDDMKYWGSGKGKDPCRTTQRNYDEFGEWMYEVLVFRHNEGRYPPWDFNGSEDRMYYRAYAIAKGIWKNNKVNLNRIMDDPFIVEVLCDWFLLGEIDTNTFLSCINGTPDPNTGIVLDWNSKTNRWDKNEHLSKKINWRKKR